MPIKGIDKEQELETLNNIFCNLREDKRGIVERLIENAAFMAQQLDKLQQIIRESGFTDEYKNGENQFGKKKSPEIEIYNTMIKNYSSLIKQLTDLLPAEQEAPDEFITFVSQRP